MSHQRPQDALWGRGCRLREVSVSPALWMDSSPWNGHSLRAPTRAIDPPRIIFMDSTKPWAGAERGGRADPLLPPGQTLPQNPPGCPPPAHLHPQISLLSGPNLQPIDLRWRNGGQRRKAGVLVAQFAVHVELQGGAGAGGTAEPQQRRVRAPVGQARLLQVHRMHSAVLPLVPHQHCRGAGLSAGPAPTPSPTTPWVSSSGRPISGATPLCPALPLNAGHGGGTQHASFPSETRTQ